MGATAPSPRQTLLNALQIATEGKTGGYAERQEDLYGPTADTVIRELGAMGFEITSASSSGRNWDFDSLLLLIDTELEGADLQNTTRVRKLLHAARVNIRNFLASTPPSPEDR